MKSKIAGVALAAVVSACAVGGAAERAEASVILNAGYSGQADVGGGIAVSVGTFTFDTADGRLDYDYDTRYDLYMLDPEQDYDVRSTGSLIASSFLSGFIGYEFGYPIDNISFNSLQISASISFAYDNGVFNPLLFTQFVSDPAIRANGHLDSVSIVSTVPLPATAPLFGAALLALGGATYARRRGKTIAAYIKMAA